jgi:hypothetical protein
MIPTLIIKEHESREQQEKISTSLCINNRKKHWTLLGDEIQ